jgi:CRISPR-associated protein Cas1
VNKLLLNTLFVGAEGSHLRLDSGQVRVEHGGEAVLTVPLHHLGAIVLFGSCTATAPLMMRCADDGRAFVFLDRAGRFRARLEGKTTGNVLLRKAHYDALADARVRTELCRRFVAAKVQNARLVLLRAARDFQDADREEAAIRIRAAAEDLAASVAQLAAAADENEVRGIEGAAAARYFEVFGDLVTQQRSAFSFDGRSRRPPRDRANCLMSFLYSVWTNDCVTACESVGLDPQFGFLHVLRPGRPALALDLVEEFRAIVLDRLVLSLVNRRQVQAADFEVREGGAVMLTDEGRKKVLAALQTRKKIEVVHPALGERVAIGLLPHVQARLLARFLRGDAPAYMPYIPT